MMTKKCCTKCSIEQDIDQYHKRAASNDGLKGLCKTCSKARRRSLGDKKSDKTYRASDKGRAAHKRYVASEGYCVYVATYPEGIYVGSGQTVMRRKSHLSGNSKISKQLGSKAISFEVLCYVLEEHKFGAEQYYINQYGLDNLLNKTDVKELV